MTASSLNWLARSFHLNDLNRDSIGSLNHGRPRVAPRVDLFEELNPFAFQPRHSRCQVRDAKGPMINDMSRAG